MELVKYFGNVKTAGEIIAKVTLGEAAIGFGSSEALDIISTNLADLMSFSGLGVALLIALGVHLFAAGLGAMIRAKSIASTQSTINLETVIVNNPTLLARLKKSLRTYKKLLSRIFSALKRRLPTRYRKKATASTATTINLLGKVVGGINKTKTTTQTAAPQSKKTTTKKAVALKKSAPAKTGSSIPPNPPAPGLIATSRIPASPKALSF